MRLQRIADPPPAALTVGAAGSPALSPCEMTRANPDEQVQLPLPPRWPEPHAEHCSEHSYPPTCRSMQARGRSGGQPGSCTTSPSTPASTMDGEETQVRMQREEEDATGAAWSRHWSPPPLPAGCSPRGTAGGDLRAEERPAGIYGLLGGVHLGSPLIGAPRGGRAWILRAVAKL